MQSKAMSEVLERMMNQRTIMVNNYLTNLEQSSGLTLAELDPYWEIGPGGTETMKFRGLKSAGVQFTIEYAGDGPGMMAAAIMKLTPVLIPDIKWNKARR